MKTKEIVLHLHSLHLKVLSMYRFSQTEAFTTAHHLANEDEIKELDLLIKNLNKDKLYEWVKSILINNKVYEALDMITLRSLCVKKKISYVNILNKMEIISLLRELDNKNEKANSDIHRTQEISK